MTGKSVTGLSLAVITLAGCTMQPAYVRPPIAVPDRWQGAEVLGSTQPLWPDGAWWQSFGDVTLNGLVDAALADNHDLKAAVSRIAQARSTARIAASSLYPTVDGKLRAERSRTFSGHSHPNSFIAELGAIYDPDLWGKSRSSRRAAQADVLAAEFARANVALVLQTDVTLGYLLLAALDQRIGLSHQNIEAAHRIDAIVDARYRAGAVSELDRALSKTSLLSIEAGLPALEQSRQQALQALAILVGKNPSDLVVQPPPVTRFTVPSTLLVGIPSELLQRRPDLRQAEANLIAANANIGVARAMLFPSISLTGQGGYVNDQLSTLVRNSNGIVALGGSVLAPIFHGGSLRANVNRSTERYEELLQQYQQTILGALREVESALIALQKLGAQVTLLQEAERQAQRAFELAEVRYRSGATDAITMLNAQNTWVGLQNSVLQSHLSQIDAWVSLFKALGGGGQ